MAAPPLSAERVCAGDLTARGSFRHHLIQDLRGDRATNRPYPQVIALPRNRKSWKRIAIGAGALAACLALAIGWVIHTQPGTSPRHVARMDCSLLYKEFWGKLENDNYARIAAEQLAGVSRMALRAYDACQAGDELDANALFKRLDHLRF